MPLASGWFDAENSYLADGLTEQLIGHIWTPGLCQATVLSNAQKSVLLILLLSGILKKLFTKSNE